MTRHRNKLRTVVRAGEQARKTASSAAFAQEVKEGDRPGKTRDTRHMTKRDNNTILRRDKKY